MTSARVRLTYMATAAAVATMLFAACSNSPNTATDAAGGGTSMVSGATEQDPPVAGEPCADRDSDNPTLRQVYEGTANLLANTALAGGSSDAEVDAIRQGNSADSALALLPPDLESEQEQIVASIPPGGYARYVSAVCEVEESFQGVPTSTSTPWAAAFDGMIACTVIARLPSSERDSYANSVEEGFRMGNARESVITYGVTKAAAAREHLCPQ